MKKLLYLPLIVMFYSCASPKYSASVKSTESSSSLQGTSNSGSSSNPYQAGDVIFTASTKASLTSSDEIKSQLKKTYMNMTKAERKEVGRLLKKELKSIPKNQKNEMSVTSTKSSRLDHDLKLAAIFGAVGIVGLLLGFAGQFFVVIGAIALIIGVVFFVKWLMEQ
jgi:hypothetical protein